jgi:hypothetical protein
MRLFGKRRTVNDFQATNGKEGEAAPHAAAKVGGPDISFRKSQKHDTQQAGPQPPLPGALIIGGGGVPGQGVTVRGA